MRIGGGKPGWVWQYVEGDGVEFDYGMDFSQCYTHNLYHSLGANEFTPFYCYLDFITYRTPGWSFHREETLSEGHAKCSFRFKQGGVTHKGWPPPFLKEPAD